MLLFCKIKNIILQRLFFKINNSRDNAVRVLKFLSEQPIFLCYFDRQFSFVCLNNDTRVRPAYKKSIDTSVKCNEILWQHKEYKVVRDLYIQKHAAEARNIYFSLHDFSNTYHFTIEVLVVHTKKISNEIGPIQGTNQRSYGQRTTKPHDI